MPPFQPKHVWAIRTRLQIASRTRDLALFNLAIDSKFRGCDVVSLKVEDVAPHGYAVDRATIRQRKTGRPVKFEITEQTRQGESTIIWLRHHHPRATICSKGAAAIGTSRPGSTRACWPNGFR
jgi:hypothetical protein